MLTAYIICDVIQVLMMKKFPDEERPSLLIDAVELSGDENHKLECLLVHVAESSPEEKDKYRSQFLTVLHWITFSSGLSLLRTSYK